MTRGTLRIYLGAAPGVGKTFAMLNEGRRRKSRGTDVVVGLVETHGRAQTEAQLADLEVVPRRTIEYQGRTFTEMDVDAILARRPEQVLVDELAHTNIPGSRNAKRWQDVGEILDAGIDVISTVNVQHLESVNDVVEQITGIRQQERIPDEIVRAAEQVELVDMTPEALRRRLAHGNVYPADRVDASLANYFRIGNLAALREIALLWVADKVEEGLQTYLEDHGIEEAWETRERVVVALTGAPGGDLLIRRAARMARQRQGDLLGVHVRPSDGLATPPSDLLVGHRRLLTEVGGTYHEIAADDIGVGLVEFARAERATQLVLGASRQSRWRHLVRGSVVARVLRSARDLDVHVISTELPSGEGLQPRPRVRAPIVSLRRRMLAAAIAGMTLPLLTVVLDQLRDHLSLPSVLLFYLLVVVGVAAVGGFLPALATAIAAFLLANYFFTPPIHTFTIAEDDNLVALVVFVVVGAVVGHLLSRAARRQLQAASATATAETLASLSGLLISEPDPLPGLVASLRSTLQCTSVAVLRGSDDEWRLESVAGDHPPTSPDDAELSIPLDADTVLAIRGDALHHEQLALLQAYASQLALAVERRRLRAEAAMAEGLAEANELRTALLAAVSHDLRTPLASIKAAASTLLQPDVAWGPAERDAMLETIEAEADRLNGLVSNLLDMSRLQTGAFEPVAGEVGLDDVIPAALRGLSTAQIETIVVEVPDDVPPVRADAALLERAIANVVENAVRASPPDRPVRIVAGVVFDRVELRVVDQGPGIPPTQREAVFQPFQRLGDQAAGTGVGLGLAVARGFVEAMQGDLAIEDTPGGGTTMVISLPAVG